MLLKMLLVDLVRTSFGVVFLMAKGWVFGFNNHESTLLYVLIFVLFGKLLDSDIHST